jgi:dTDP-4-dehydrorhamnose reductase
MILLIGSNGFVGKEILQLLKKKKKSFISISRKKSTRHSHFKLNLENIRKLEDLINKFKVNTIINCAAKVNFKDKKFKLCSINYKLPKFLADYCKKKKIFLIHLSTVIVHGSNKNFYYKSAPYMPDLNYSKNKLLADRYIKKIKCKSAILRMGGIYGLNGPNHLTINKTLKDAKYKKKIPIITRDLLMKRNYIYVKDLANFIVKLSIIKKTGIYYLSGNIITIKKMINIISNIFFGKDPKIKKFSIFKSKKDQKSKNDQLVKKNINFKITNFSKSIKEFI